MENAIMTRWNWLLVAALGVGSGACSEATGSTSSLGNDALALRAAPADLDLDTCLGTRCGKGEVEPEPAEFRTRTCEPEPVDDLEVRWQREAPTSCPGIGECSIQSYGGDNFVLAADGAIWLASAISTPERDGQVDGVFLGYFSSDGLAGGAEMLDQETSNIGEAIEYTASLAKVDGLDATVIISKYILREGESEPTHESWLTNHELWSATPAPKTLSLAPPRDVWSTYPQSIVAMQAGPERLLLASNDWGSRAIALLATDENKPVWVQTRAGLAPHDALTVDGDNRATLLILGPWDEETMASLPTIEHYEANGQLAWIRVLPAPWGQSSWSKLAADHDGNIINVAVEQPNAEPSAMHVQKLNPDGDTDWVVKITQEAAEQGWGSAAAPTFDKDGNIFLVGPSFYEEPTDPDGDYVGGQLLYEISADGERCRSHRVLSANMERLVIAENGDIYFFGWNFGRLLRK
jgi:hypothetical protein